MRWASASASLTICSDSRSARASRPSACARECDEISSADSWACWRMRLVCSPTSSSARCTVPSRVWVASSSVISSITEAT